MIRLFVNALAASAGGGVTYVRNVVRHLALRNDVETTIAMTPWLRKELPAASNIFIVECEFPSSAGPRFWKEQKVLPKLLHQYHADVLLSAGNFALRACPVPQILLSRNALYVSSDYYRDLLRRHEYTRWFDTKIKGRLAASSVRNADVTVAPSAAFAKDLRIWVGMSEAEKVIWIHHGFDAEAFRFIKKAPESLARQLENPHQALRLLMVSNYTYYRNFETVLRALSLVQRRISRRVELLLTCKLGNDANPGGYSAHDAALLCKQLELGTSVVELGPVSYDLLHFVYGACEIYVAPAYAETFAHPLVEAMSSGLPIIASDLPVHREICGQAASYFPTFSTEELADEVVRLEKDLDRRTKMSEAGLLRSRDFSWEKHVDRIVQLAYKVRAGDAPQLQSPIATRS